MKNSSAIAETTQPSSKRTMDHYKCSTGVLTWGFFLSFWWRSQYWGNKMPNSYSCIGPRKLSKNSSLSFQFVRLSFVFIEGYVNLTYLHGTGTVW